MENNSCRMYENSFPEVEDLILVQVKSVDHVCAYVSLLEYDNIEGMIQLSELSRRRIRSINKLIRVGRTEVVVVLRVDAERKYIDLSKRRVSQEDISNCEAKYNKSKAVHSIMRHVSETCKVPLKDLYDNFGWDLYKKYGHAYDAFKMVIKNEQVLLDYKLEEKVHQTLIKNITRRLAPQPVRLRADLEVRCFSEDGIEAIKDALRSAEARKEMQIKIKLVAPPLYVMMTTCLDKNYGIQILEEACEGIKEIMKARGGECEIKEKPRTVSDRDDKILADLMDNYEKENAETYEDDE